MTTTMNPSDAFQHYVKNKFKFPKEIKQDIVYCQRALKAHIKVHQMVLDVFKTQGDSMLAVKQRITDELETQIYEINAEQQFLLLRLRRQIFEFKKFLERRGVHVIPNAINDAVSSELVPLINDKNFLVYPTSVRLRSSEEQLIEKYFEVKENDAAATENYFEILDSDEEELKQNYADNGKESGGDWSKLPKRKASYKAIPNSNSMDTDNMNERHQTSLLKPLDQRSPLSSSSSKCDTNQFVELSSGSQAAIAPNIMVSTMKKKVDATKGGGGVYPVYISASKDLVEFEPDDSSVPQNVKQSRMNLRQVLKNAQSGKISSSAKNAISKASVPPSPYPICSAERKDMILTKKVDQSRNNFNPNAPTTANVAACLSSSSSSDDSTPERCLEEPIKPSSSSSSQFPLEKVETRLKPDDYGQEMFLRIFGLYTPEMHLQMQQRRSKRKRRTVQSNERSDYHYGHIEYGNNNAVNAAAAATDDKKKRKVFLVSPQVKRKQGRPPKRRSIEKSDETSTSRSGTSSPDDKHRCNECLKSGGSLKRCDNCKSYYHKYCHTTTTTTTKSGNSNNTKTCPSCRRSLEKETQQNECLQNNADRYKQRLTDEKTRRKSLQQKSQTFKMQMNALLNIIKAIKRDS